MPVYEYKALDVGGKRINGIIDAESALSARGKLRASKIFPVSIEKAADSATPKAPGTPSLSGIFSRVKASEISYMTRQLSTLIGAGFPLVTAIDTLIPHTKSNTFKKMLAQLKDTIVEGKSFAHALNRYPRYFSQLYVNMVRAGETSGTLGIILDRLAEISEKQLALYSRIKTALVYPVFMSLFGSLVLFLLLAFIVPSITSIFSEMDQLLPAPTRFLIYVSALFKHYWWTLFLGIGAIIIGFRAVNKSKRGRLLIDQKMITLPFFGVIVKKLSVSRFSRTLASLLENGVSMMPALEIVKNITGNVLIENAIEEAANEVEKGKGLGDSLAASSAFPQLAIQMIQVGEQSGELESMLDKIADVFENEVESNIMQVTSLLEPAMIVVMGIIVGFIVISVCLPIFEMNQLIK